MTVFIQWSQAIQRTAKVVIDVLIQFLQNHPTCDSHTTLVVFILPDFLPHLRMIIRQLSNVVLKSIFYVFLAYYLNTIIYYAYVRKCTIFGIEAGESHFTQFINDTQIIKLYLHTILALIVLSRVEVVLLLDLLLHRQLFCFSFRFGLLLYLYFLYFVHNL